MGEEAPSFQHLIDSSACRTPVLVVTPVKENTGTSVRLFGLVLPRSGLCQPVLLQHARIFYRWEFRASAGSRADQRNKNWNQIVINKALELDPGRKFSTRVEAPPSSRAATSSRLSDDVQIKQEYDTGVDFNTYDVADNSTDIVLRLDDIFRPKVFSEGPVVLVDIPTMTHMRIILTSEARAVISHIRRTNIERAENELRKFLLDLNLLTQEAQYPNLSRFPLLDADLTPSTAALLEVEIRELYPKVAKFVQRSQLVRVQALLRYNRIPIAYPWLEEFLTDIIPFSIAPRINDEQLLTRMHSTATKLSSRWSPPEVPGADRRQLPPASPDVILIVCLLEQFFYIHKWQLLATQSVNGMGDRPESLNSHEFAHTIHAPTINEDLTIQFPDVLIALHQVAQQSGCGAEDILLWSRRLYRVVRNSAGN